MIIAIPGGHLTPALAVIDYIRQRQFSDTIVFFGREFSQDQVQQVSQESREISKRSNTHFVPFMAPRSMKNPYQVLFFVISVIKAVYVLRTHQVDKVLSFGGYQAVPICLAAALMRIPIVTHEQTKTVGNATKLIAKWSSFIALSYSDSVKSLPKSLQQRALITGNPIRQQLLEKVGQPSWSITTRQPILFVTGGNQGSLAINQLIGELLPQLVKSWYVIHQTGNPTSEHNYVDELSQMHAALPIADQQYYHVQSWYSEAELAWIWPHTTLALARAGANTVSEVMLFGIPTIFIPLPNAHQNEQHENIQPLLEADAAVEIDQSVLTSDTLLSEINAAHSRIEELRQHLSSFSPNLDASEKVYELVVHA